jgi:hypothetical protein
MPIQSELPAPAAGNGTSAKLLRLLRKRLRQLARVTLVLAVGVALGAAALGIWWLTSLNGFPDIGDPFDVAEFRAFSVPEELNAFTLKRRAWEKLTPVRGLVWGEGADPDALKLSWSIANPKWREWAGENREALELLLQAADRADASHPAGESTAGEDTGNLIILPILEASRRQESGDMEGAWDCYRGLIRMITHFRRRGSTWERCAARRTNPWLLRRLTDWAADPRTSMTQLHSALKEVLRNEPDPHWDVFAIKYGYLEIISAMERPIPSSTRQEYDGEWTIRLGDMALSPGMVDYLEGGRRFLLREPERSRRALRLLCANYLAHAEGRERPRRQPAVWAMFSFMTTYHPIRKRKISIPLYPVSPDAPAGARALPPKELAGWLVTTLDARLHLLDGYIEWYWPSNRVVAGGGTPDRKAHRDLVIMLATELYRRERGALPPSEESLVGTYLESLPDLGSAGETDEKAVTVE